MLLYRSIKLEAQVLLIIRRLISVWCDNSAAAPDGTEFMVVASEITGTSLHSGHVTTAMGESLL